MIANWTTASYYKHETLSVYVANVSGGTVTIDNVLIDGVAYTFSARHTAINGTLKIDLTDLMRMASTTFSLRLTDGSGSKTLTGNYAGLTDPTNYVAPLSPTAAIIAPYLNDPALNLPLPSMIIQGDKLRVEYIISNGEIPVPIKHIADDSEFGIFCIEDGKSYFVWSVNDAPEILCRMIPQQCGVRYWRADWVSRVGHTKSHYWEVVKVTESTSKTQEIEPLNNEWDVRKNRLVSVTLRLTGLNAYDVWYYSDIITSNDVLLTTENGVSHVVNVTTKKVTTPDGDAGKLNTLEIDVEYFRTEGI